jgi:hypothetical protein
MSWLRGPSSRKNQVLEATTQAVKTAEAELKALEG